LLIRPCHKNSSQSNSTFYTAVETLSVLFLFELKEERHRLYHALGLLLNRPKWHGRSIAWRSSIVWTVL